MENLNIQVERFGGFKIASIRVKGPYTRISEAFKILVAWLIQRQATVEGPPFGIFYNSPEDTEPENLDWEIGFPISGEVEGNETVSVRLMPEKLSITALHRGSYEKINETYQKIYQYASSNNYTPEGPIIEMYLSDPAKTPPDKLLTKIVVPVR